MSVSLFKVKMPGPLTEEEQKLPPILCFMVAVPGEKGSRVYAMSQDGEFFVNSICQNEDDAWNMVGYKIDPSQDIPEIHQQYLAHYPQGCRLVWERNPEGNPDVEKALDKILEAMG